MTLCHHDTRTVNNPPVTILTIHGYVTLPLHDGTLSLHHWKTATYGSEKLHLQPNQVTRGEETDQR